MGMKTLDPPQPPEKQPVRIPIGQTGYTLRILDNGGAQLAETTPDGSFLLAILSAKDLETFEYQLHYTTGGTR